MRYIPSTAGKFAINATKAGGAALKMSLGPLDVPPLVDGTVEVGKVLEIGGAPGAEGPGQ